MYELLIIGAGPAGVAAAVYAARKQLKTVLVTKEWGGQSTVSPEIFNWIGEKSISGIDLAKKFEEHVRDYEGEYLDIIDGVTVDMLAEEDGFWATLSDGKTIEAKTVFVASGSGRRKLNIPGAEEFENKGVVYCASCDGPLFSGKDVVVVGGGNAGFETAAQLSAYCKSVTLLHRSASFKADEITVEKVLEKDNVVALKNSEPVEILGDAFVSGVKYIDKEGGEEKRLEVQGVFVEIGQIPNTEFIEGLVHFDDYKRIVVDPRTQKASKAGIWAAGDVTDGLYHQNNIAAGDAVKAIENIYLSIHAGGK